MDASRTTIRAVFGAGCAAALVGGACARTATPEPTPAPRLSQVSDSAWSTTPVARLEELLVGRFPGVQVFGTGARISVRIRGATSLLGSNQPLYVVDGFPLEPDGAGLIGINPADVARIEVLKDAGSIAEYGMRGANGVIRITTKGYH